MRHPGEGSHTFDDGLRWVPTGGVPMLEVVDLARDLASNTSMMGCTTAHELS